jgi:hypothetical protein
MCGTGELSRFATPRQLMTYIRLELSEPCLSRNPRLTGAGEWQVHATSHSSGASVKRGGLTKASDSTARRLLLTAKAGSASLISQTT